MFCATRANSEIIRLLEPRLLLIIFICSKEIQVSEMDLNYAQGQQVLARKKKVGTEYEQQMAMV
jgi:hypothetical protein